MRSYIYYDQRYIDIDNIQICDKKKQCQCSSIGVGLFIPKNMNYNFENVKRLIMMFPIT
jgi:hypothetical protein